jgi:hypothetical protein
MKTLQQLAEEALAVQDACNLSGVAHGFARAISNLRELENLSTDALNRHPICILWADKIAHLTGTQAFGSDSARDRTNEITGAYNRVIELTKGE